MHPKNLSIADFTYSLPEDRIAHYPLPQRDASKLLIYEDAVISEDVYKNISSYIPENSLLLFNDTKVIEARLLFQKPTGGTIEIFCLAPHERYSDITTAMLQTGQVQWLCLVGGASKWKKGQVLEKNIHFDSREIKLRAIYEEKRTDSFVIELTWSPSTLSFAELLHHAGAIPLPPYIKRKADASDAKRYQTIYAHWDGSVAAPTAGLHFTDQIFKDLSSKHIQTTFMTLHVGAGTFKPVKSERMEEHEMHGEFIDVSRTTLESILSNLHNPIIPVGTTSMRTLESLYWMGVKLIVDKNKKSNTGPQLPPLLQWEAYDIQEQAIPAKEALEALLQWMSDNGTGRLLTSTRIIIAPGYRPRLANALITNFHQPQSTLLLLIAALAGEDWRKIYSYAMEHDFRFLSYGDGCLLWINK